MDERATTVVRVAATYPLIVLSNTSSAWRSGTSVNSRVTGPPGMRSALMIFV
jgi:hypothetical protein